MSKYVKYIVLLGVVFVVVGVATLFLPIQSKKKTTVSTNKNKTLKNTVADVIYNPEDFIAVKTNGLFGFINTKGEMVIEPQYERATDFYNGYASVVAPKKGKNGYDSYQLIDKEGKVKFALDASQNASIDHLENGNWLIGKKIYDSTLKQLTSDDAQVFKGSGNYFVWVEKGKTGIMDLNGNITYTAGKSMDINILGIDSSNYDNNLKDQYCAVRIQDSKMNEKSAIVNCETGKVVYDYVDKFITTTRDNIFTIEDKNNNFEKSVYILNDKISYETDYKDASFSLGYSVFTIHDKDNKTIYLDADTGETLKDSQDTRKKLPDYYTEQGYTLKKCVDEEGTSYGIEKDKKEILPCNGWVYFQTFKEPFVNYLNKEGKDYIFAYKDFKHYLIDLKTSQVINEFDVGYIYPSSGPIVRIEFTKDGYDNELYNVLNGKSIKTNEYNVYTYSNYSTIRENGKVKYYNEDLELIYEGENTF